MLDDGDVICMVSLTNQTFKNVIPKLRFRLNWRRIMRRSMILCILRSVVCCKYQISKTVYSTVSVCILVICQIYIRI